MSVEMLPWDNSFRLKGAPKTRYKAAIMASRATNVQSAVEQVARVVAANARLNLATSDTSSAEEWGSTGIDHLSVECKRGDYLDWHVNLVAKGRGNMIGALFSLENGRRSYHNKQGRKIPATQGKKILAGATGSAMGAF